MTHSEVNAGMLRSWMDGALSADQAEAISMHLGECASCRATLQTLQSREAAVRSAMDELPGSSGGQDGGQDDVARGWAAFNRKRDESQHQQWRWSAAKSWGLAAGAACATALLLLTVGPVRAWAQEILAIFRVEHFTVLAVNPELGANLENNHMLNQSVSRMLSDHIKVTQQPQPPQTLSGEEQAKQLAGFDVRFLPGGPPSKLTLESGAAAEFTLNRDRLQSILDEAGRSDLQIPAEVDGAVVNFRIAAGIMATYDRCPDGRPQPETSKPCITVMQVPSPVVRAPQGFDPAQLAQVGLEFLGMSAKDAASFTQTVDWTSTLVLPVSTGTMSYKEIPIHGVQAVLLRDKRPTASSRYAVTWIDDGIVYALESYGDDASAVDLAAQLN